MNDDNLFMTKWAHNGATSTFSFSRCNKVSFLKNKVRKPAIVVTPNQVDGRLLCAEPALSNGYVTGFRSEFFSFHPGLKKR